MSREAWQTKTQKLSVKIGGEFRIFGTDKSNQHDKEAANDVLHLPFSCFGRYDPVCE